MDYKNIISRLTGFSTPIFGISWKPSAADRTVARRVIAFLEDRRVFYNPYHMEMEYHCVESILETRKYLTQIIGDLPEKNELAMHLRAIRAACRQFIDTVGQPDHPGSNRRFHGEFASGFFEALGQLRATAGIHIGAIAVMYGLSIEGKLSEILPPALEERDGA